MFESQPSVLTAALATAVTLLLSYRLWKKQHQQCNYPPGPFSLPIIGNLHGILLSGSMQSYLNRCRKIYGDIFTIEFGGSKRVVVSGYDNVYSLLVKNADYTSNRTYASMPQLFQEIAAITPGIIWAPPPYWKTLRGFSTSILRDEGMGKSSMEPKVAAEINEFCDFFIKPNLGKSVGLDGLPLAANNIVSEMIFGGRSEYDDEEFLKLTEAVNETVKATIIASVTKNIPLANLFERSGIQAIRECTDLMTYAMQTRLETSKANFDPSNLKDLFDHFISYQRSHEGAESNVAFADDNAGVLAAHLYGAGTETTSTALSWALLYSLLHPSVIQRAQAEIDSVIGRNGPISYKDRAQMPFTEAVLLESLRLSNIVMFSLPHVIERSMVVDGKTIPAGADLMMNMSSILHDETVFERPYQFDPDRFLTGDVAMKKKRNIPFSLGRRVCLGESLARVELFMFYTTLLQRYDISLSEETPSPSTTPVEGLVNAAQPYKVVFSIRQ